MTTILADVKLGVVVADSHISDGDRIWFGRKVWRIKGTLVALSGDADEGIQFLAWIKGGKKPKFDNSSALILSPNGLAMYDWRLTAEPIKSGREAIGTGAKAAMCAYEALGWADPKKAVQIVCKHDAGSRGPVRVYKL